MQKYSNMAKMVGSSLKGHRVGSVCGMRLLQKVFSLSVIEAAPS